VTSALELAQKCFDSRHGQLLIGGVPIGEITKAYGTPLFIYDRMVLERKYQLLRKTFPPEFSISYSMKANPNPAILKFFLSKGCGLEVASSGELRLAMAAGCPSEKILFAGPGKTEPELETALRNQIGELHAESLLEIQRIGRISRYLGVQARIAIRVNPSEDAEGGAMRMGGKSAPFGIDEDQLEAVLDVALSEASIDLCGIHLFSGTQILNHATLTRQYSKGLEIARRVVERVGHQLETIDFGGGLGIPYFAGEQELDMDQLRAGIATLMSESRNSACFSGSNFIIEPGRFLVGESGVYVARVIDIKISRGKKFVIVDGGMNHHLAASGNLGQTIKRNFPVAIANKLTSVETETVDVVGPLCTPLDVLARNAKLPEAEVDDLFVVFQSGAYARTASPLGFLSHPAPPEVLVEKQQHHLIRQRGDFGAIL